MFVVAEVTEDVEAAREMSIQFALDRPGGVQMRRQILKEADALALTAPSDALDIVQEADAILAPAPANLVDMVQELRG